MKALARRLRPTLAWLALLVPFGLLSRNKPRHYREMLRVLWQNRGRWRYALRILQHGVCDGCSLGPRGAARRRHPRRAPVPDAPEAAAAQHDAGRSPTPRSRDIGSAARAVQRGAAPPRARAVSAAPPARRRRLSRISWDDAPRLIAARMRAADPDRMGVFVSSRGLTNEAYYVAPEAGAHRRHAARRLLRAAVPRGVGVGPEADHRLGRADLLALRHDRHRPDRAHRHRPRQQPAGDDEVHALRQAAGDAHRRRQSVPRAGARSLLGAVGGAARRCSARR